MSRYQLVIRDITNRKDEQKMIDFLMTTNAGEIKHGLNGIQLLAPFYDYEDAKRVEREAWKIVRCNTHVYEGDADFLTIEDVKLHMGVTKTYVSDRYPYTLIGIHDTKTVIVQEDEDIVISGSEFDGSAQYTYKRYHDAEAVILTRARKDGYWKDQGGTVYILGNRRRYRDPHF